MIWEYHYFQKHPSIVFFIIVLDSHMSYVCSLCVYDLKQPTQISQEKLAEMGAIVSGFVFFVVCTLCWALNVHLFMVMFIMFYVFAVSILVLDFDSLIFVMVFH